MTPLHSDLSKENERLRRRVAELERDGSARLELEEQLRLQQEKLTRAGRLSTMGQMAASIAHEVAQPLAAVSTYTASCLRLLELGFGEGPDVQMLIEKANQQAQRAAGIIRNIRQLLESKANPRGTVRVNTLVHETMTLVHPTLRAAGIPVTLDLDPNLHPVIGDHIQLQQVIQNLVQNAVDSCQENPREGSHVALRTVSRSETEIEVVVSDTGNGFDLNEFDLICQPFHTTKPEGTGLGLPISRSIVESHGGRLWATERPGGGARLHFTLAV